MERADGCFIENKEEAEEESKDRRFLYECRTIGAITFNGRYILPSFIMSKDFCVLIGC